ncbi:MAG TPA: hypothetical protein VFO35_16660, partial [Steroidobacteraceae bacterium]|nr:hypothetical protein [Steroidobacteraceae bacterium]
MLPAVPALALLTAPYLVRLATRRGAQRAMFGLAAAVSVFCAALSIYFALRPDKRADLVDTYGLDPLGPPILMTIVGVAICAVARPRRGFQAIAAVLTAMLLIVSFWTNPQLNDARSGESFVAGIEQAADPRRELGLVAFKEQYLLHARRPIVHFGHARWREEEQEWADAA